MILDDVIKISSKAKNEIQRIFINDNPPKKTGLRIKVVEGGCSGLLYKLDFGSKEQEDHIFKLNEHPVYIDTETVKYIKGMSLNYTDGFSGRGFVFKNPNAVSTCSCGESFTV